MTPLEADRRLRAIELEHPQKRDPSTRSRPIRIYLPQTDDEPDPNSYILTGDKERDEEAIRQMESTGNRRTIRLYFPRDEERIEDLGTESDPDCLTESAIDSAHIKPDGNNNEVF